MSTVFMLVGLPDPKRDPKYHKAGCMLRIRDAIVDLARVALTNGHTLMAVYHPAVSPILTRIVGYEEGGGKGILAEFRLDYQDTSAAEASRLDMLDGLRKCDMVVLIGGMEGEIASWEIAKATGAKMYPVASTGALAAELFDKGEGPADPALRKALKSELIYQFLFETLLGVTP